MSMKNKIIKELIDLNLPLNGEYFEYWLVLLLADYEGKFKNKNTMTKYAYLAKKFDSTIDTMERMLRYGKRMMEERIIEKYNIRTKITNESVIILFELMIFK